MNNLVNKAWWNAAITRAIKTVAQTATAIIGTAMVICIRICAFRYLFTFNKSQGAA